MDNEKHIIVNGYKITDIPLYEKLLKKHTILCLEHMLKYELLFHGYDLKDDATQCALLEYSDIKLKTIDEVQL